MFCCYPYTTVQLHRYTVTLVMHACYRCGRVLSSGHARHLETCKGPPEPPTEEEIAAQVGTYKHEHTAEPASVTQQLLLCACVFGRCADAFAVVCLCAGVAGAAVLQGLAEPRKEEETAVAAVAVADSQHS
jgi:hypothetical protein